MSSYLRAMLRRDEEAAFNSRCDVTRADGEGGFDSDGHWTVPGETVYSDIPALAVPSAARGVARTVDVAGSQLTLSLYDVWVDADVDVRVDDVLRFTTSADPLLVDHDLVVREVEFNEHITTRRLICEGATP